jgi:hypothetical protein
MRSNVSLSKILEKKWFIRSRFIAAIGITVATINISDVSAMSLLVTRDTLMETREWHVVTPVVVVRRGAVARRTTAVGPRGGVASRTVVRRGAVVRPGVVRPGLVRPGAWVRPTWYRWAPGGAIAAGAALGFCDGGHPSRMGGCAASYGILLVLHRCQQAAGLLGQLPAPMLHANRSISITSSEDGRLLRS